MALSMYQASVPVFIRMLGNLRALLLRAAAHAEARKFDSKVLVESRLAPDMYPLSRQVQIASDTAKGCGARLAGLEPPSYADTEQTLAELVERIDRTLDYLHTLSAAQIDGSEERAITLPLRSGAMHFDGQSYLLNFALPNFFFHVSTSYALLRHNGVEIGKLDYLGRG